MKDKTKLNLWITLDIVLLVGLLYAGSVWLDINNTLKNPCSLCAYNNKTVSDCVNYERQLNPFGVELNLSGIEINFTVKNKIINITKNRSLPLF